MWTLSREESPERAGLGVCSFRKQHLGLCSWTPWGAFLRGMLRAPHLQGRPLRHHLTGRLWLCSLPARDSVSTGTRGGCDRWPPVLNPKAGTGGLSALSASPACSGELERQSPRAVTHPRPVFLLGPSLFLVLSASLRSPCAPWRWAEAAGRSPRACWPWLGVDGWRTHGSPAAGHRDPHSCRTPPQPGSVPSSPPLFSGCWCSARALWPR